MFNVGGGEIMVILLLALLVLGPDKLPEYARKAGRYMNEFRRMTSGFQEEFRQAVDLGDVMKPPSSDSTPATSSDDALDRTTEGPRLLPSGTTAATPPPPDPKPVGGPESVVPEPVVAEAAPTVDPPAQTAAGAFSADIVPAPGTGPELITPSQPPADHEGDAGSSSAA